MSYPIVIAASAAYAIGAVTDVELQSGRRVGAVGAFGPVLIALGGSGYGLAPFVVLIAITTCCEALLVLLRRTQGIRRVRHVLTFLVGSGLFAAVGSFEHRVTPRVLMGVAAASTAYALAEVPTVRLRRWRALVTEMRNEVLDAGPVYAVLISTAGLTVLAIPRLGWAACVVLLLPVFATRQEFKQFGDIRRRYSTTVRALASLAEGAGYASEGHHDRVAKLCVALGEQAGLSQERITKLELLALLHDVGAVSYPEPADAVTAGRRAIADRTAELIEDTGYLQGYGRVLVEAAGAPTSLESRILAVASAYEDAQGDPSERLGYVESTVVADDRLLVSALQAVVNG